jgi:hypothetical protein
MSYYYSPDSWVIIRIEGNDPHYRVLAGWNGGYAKGDSCRMNSGIVKAIEEEDYWLFIGSSGSTYACHKDMYGLRTSTIGTWRQLQDRHGDKVELMEEDTDWMNLDWIIDK